MKICVNGNVREMTDSEEKEYKEILSASANEATVEERLAAVEETADTTATAVEELINVVMGGEE